MKMIISAFKVSLTRQLFYLRPILIITGHILSINPDPKAIGYDAGITNGGLYSAQVNLEKNIFNGRIAGCVIITAAINFR